MGRGCVGGMNKDLNASQPVLKWAEAFRLKKVVEVWRKNLRGVALEGLYVWRTKASP